MKILHITAYITGGAGIAVMRLHQALLAKGIDSKVLAMYVLDENMSEGIFRADEIKNPLTKILDKLKFNKNDRLLGELKGNYEAFTFPFSHHRLHKHPLVLDADVIHLHWISDFVDIPSFFTNVQKPLIWTAHDLNPILGGFHYEGDVLRNPLFSELEEKLKNEKHKYIELAKVHFIGSSIMTVDKIKTYLPNAKSTRIPCILDTNGFMPAPSETAKTTLNIRVNSLLLGTGADDLENYRKGYWLLIEAISGLSDQEKNAITILSFGSSKKLSAVDTANQVPSMIKFEPIHDKTMHSLLYSAMDYFVAPSLEETFGLTGTEALLCNTPLIAAKTGGMLDYVNDGINGFLFETGQVEDLRFKIKLAIQSKKAGQPKFNDCRETLLVWYKQEDPVNKHIELYKELLALTS